MRQGRTERPCTCEYDVTVEDLVAQNLFHSRHSHALRVRYLETLALVVPAIFAASWLITQDLRAAAAAGGILALFWVAYYPFAFQAAVKRHVLEEVRERGDGILSRHRLRLLPKGIMERTDDGVLFWPWRVVDRVLWDDDHVYIFGKSFVSHAVPRRAFPDWRSYRDFEGLVRVSIERAHADELARQASRQHKRFGRVVST